MANFVARDISYRTAFAQVVAATSPLPVFDDDALRVPALGALKCALAVIRNVRLDTNNRHWVAALRANQILNHYRLARPET